MQLTYTTPRLHLVRLTDTADGSQHLGWWHELWTDDAFTLWSLHGKTTSYADSRAWMIEHLTQFNTIYYAVFEKPAPTPDNSSIDIATSPGKLIGGLGLRQQSKTGAIPPPPPPGAHSEAWRQRPFDLRMLGYAYFASAWGKGYATEAGKVFMDGYREACTLERARAKERGEAAEDGALYYVEAIVGPENPRSVRVLEKLGLDKVGWFKAEPIFLGGAMTGPGAWIYGCYA